MRIATHVPRPSRRRNPNLLAPKSKTLPPREKVKLDDPWDLASLFTSDAEWEAAFEKWKKQIPQLREVPRHARRRRQAARRVPEVRRRVRPPRRAARHLRLSQDGRGQANSDYQRMRGRMQNAASEAAQAASFIRPEILAIPAKKLDEFLAAKELAPFPARCSSASLRYKPHTLTDGEEKLLAMQSEMADAVEPHLPPAQRRRPEVRHVKNEKGESVELSHSSFSSFLHSPDRNVRARRRSTSTTAVFDAHENTLAADAQRLGAARRVLRQGPRLPERPRAARCFTTTCRSRSTTTHRRGPPQAAGGLQVLRAAAPEDEAQATSTTTTPTCRSSASSIQQHTWKQAVDVVVESLEPLGDEYCRVLRRRASTGRWCDRYPNQRQAERRVQLRHRSTATRTS